MMDLRKRGARAMDIDAFEGSVGSFIEGARPFLDLRAEIRAPILSASLERLEGLAERDPFLIEMMEFDSHVYEDTYARESATSREIDRIISVHDDGGLVGRMTGLLVRSAKRSQDRPFPTLQRRIEDGLSRCISARRGAEFDQVRKVVLEEIGAAVAQVIHVEAHGHAQFIGMSLRNMFAPLEEDDDAGLSLPVAMCAAAIALCASTRGKEAEVPPADPELAARLRSLATAIPYAILEDAIASTFQAVKARMESGVEAPDGP
jgi:hypothetical protein